MSQADIERAQGKRINSLSLRKDSVLTPTIAQLLDILLSAISICLNQDPPVYLSVSEGKPQ